jgi:uncharacterized protein involved in outer membrane biogenesis
MRKRNKWIAWFTITPVVLISALLFFVVTFDWNRARPWLNERVSQAIGRPFAINGDLSVKWDRPDGETGWRRWVPWPRLSARDVVVGNPDWAGESNFATANEVSFVLQALPLLTHRIVIPTVSLDTPSIALLRRKDGENNWSFPRQQDKPPMQWELELQQIVFKNGRVALSDAVKQLELLAEVDTIGGSVIDLENNAPAKLSASDASPQSASPKAESALPPPVARSTPSSAPDAASEDTSAPASTTTSATQEDGSTASNYGIQWTVKGTYRDARVRGSGKAGGVLRLQDRDTPYPIQADVRLGRTRIALEGTITDPAKLAAIDLRLRLSGDSMAHLYDLTGVVLPETAPFETRGRLVGATSGEEDARAWRYEKFTGRMGKSDIQGTLTYLAQSPRPKIEGSVVSNQLVFADLAPLIGADSTASKQKRGAAERQPSERLLPVAQFKTDRWGAMDADVKLTGKRIVRDEALPISDLSAHLVMQDSVLTLEPLNFGVAGGPLVSTIRLNGKAAPLQGTIDLRARRLKLQQLFPTIEAMRASVGELNGAARLSARGNSISSLLGSANGEAKLLVREGTISKFILEAMGLNVGSVVLTQLFGDRQVALNCGVSDFAIHDGLARARAFVVDTEDATIYITGGVDFKDERLGMTVRPEAKGLRLFSLRAPLYVTGTLKKPDVSVDKAVLALRAGGALALGLTAPIAAALIPLTDLSSPEDTRCVDLLRRASAEPRTNPKPVPPTDKTAPARSMEERTPTPAAPQQEQKRDPLPPIYNG